MLPLHPGSNYDTTNLSLRDTPAGRGRRAGLAALAQGAARRCVRAWWLQAAPADMAGFARAEGPRAMVFPADHGPHDDFQTEWWYYTGNLTAETGEHFGYQLTFFRRALIAAGSNGRRATPPGARIRSTWRTSRSTDVSGGEHYSFERLAPRRGRPRRRQAEPFRVWLEDWEVAEAVGCRCADQASKSLRSGAEAWRRHRHLRAARRSDLSLDLNLADLKGPVLQGDRGYSRKGPEPGNASYYVSLHAHRHRGHGDGGRQDVRRDWPELDGSRVEHQRAGRGAGRLGLVQHPARRRAPS